MELELSLPEELDEPPVLVAVLEAVSESLSVEITPEEPGPPVVALVGSALVVPEIEVRMVVLSSLPVVGVLESVLGSAVGELASPPPVVVAVEELLVSCSTPTLEQARTRLRADSGRVVEVGQGRSIRRG